MGYVSFTDGRAYARVCQKVGTNQIPGCPGDTYDWSYSNDITFSFYGDFNGYALVSHPIYMGDILGLQANSFDLDRRADFRTYKPPTSPWLYEEDRLRYPAPRVPLNEVLAQDHSPEFLKEKQTNHAKYSGELRDRFSDISEIYRDSNYSSVTNYWDGFHVSKLETTPEVVGVYTAARQSGVADNGQRVFELGFSTEYPIGWNTHAGCDYVKFFDETASYIESVGQVSYAPHPWWRMYTRSMTHSAEFDGYTGKLQAAYEYEMRADSPYGVAYVRFDVNIDYRFTFRPAGAVYGIDPSEFNLINVGIFTDANLSTVNVIDWGGTDPNWGMMVDPSYHPPRVDQVWSLIRGEEDGVPPIFYSFPVQFASNVRDRFRLYRCYNGTNPNLRHDVFMKMTRDDLPNVRPSSFIAASDALDSSLEVLSANHIENLSQITGLLKLLPDLGSIPKLAAKACNGDPSAILELVDYVTDAILKYRFAQSPTVSDIEEIIEAGDIRKKVTDLAKARALTVYGQFLWDYPQDLNYIGDGRLVLEVHSKIRLVTDFSSLMVSLISANSVGLLPTLSRVWETMPFTFVVDWFTNMSQRLKLVDNQLLYYAIRTSWSVYSYKFLYYPDSTELAPYGLEVPPSSGDPFSLSAYYREFSRSAPRLRDSKYDFLAASRPPNLVTVASLIWQTAH